MRVGFMGILIASLAIVGLWHLFAAGGKRSASVWFFLGRMGLVLGALLLVGVLLGGVSTYLSHVPWRDSQCRENGAEAKSPWKAIAGGDRRKPATDLPDSIDKLWARLNQPRIPVSPVEAEKTASDEKAVVKVSGSMAGDKNADTVSSVVEASPPQGLTDKDFSPLSSTVADTGPVASGERPDWVVHPPKRVGNTYQRVVESGPFRTVDECHQELEEKLRRVIYHRMVSAGADAPDYRDFSLAALETLGIGNDYIYREICRDEYVESMEASFGPMVRVYLLLVFDPPIEKHLGDLWREYQVDQRFRSVAFLSVAGLLLLGAVYGLLKFERWTRGVYDSRHLLLGAPVAIIGLTVLWLFWHG